MTSNIKVDLSRVNTNELAKELEKRGFVFRYMGGERFLMISLKEIKEKRNEQKA